MRPNRGRGQRFRQAPLRRLSRRLRRPPQHRNWTRWLNRVPMMARWPIFGIQTTRAQSPAFFLKTYPDSTLASNAQYWIGYSYYALKDYKTSLAHQQKLLVAYPDSNKVPDALLNIATNQIALDNLPAARKTLEELVAKYPGTNAATLASRRLAALK